MNIILVLMILLVPLLLYGFNFSSIAFNHNLYKKEFSKYNVYENLEGYDIENINRDVLNYLKSEKNNQLIENDFFNAREKTHLLDVKNLIQTLFNIFYISIILFLLLFVLLISLMKFNLKKIIKRFLIILLFGSILTFLDAGLFFILSNFNFNFVFNIFHTTFFSFGSYTFNPVYENIVVLYPQNLFFDFLIKIIANTILSSTIILFFCLVLLFIFFKFNFLKIFKKIPTGK